jgi:DNA-binding response OmpR family regulator
MAPMRTVVVIEEDGAMHALVCEWLVQAGYRVVSEGDRADLVILDLPNLRAGGAARVRAVQASRPGVALIGLSTQLGRSLPADSVSARSLGVAALVAKPCRRDELLHAVAAALHTTG